MASLSAIVKLIIIVAIVAIVLSPFSVRGVWRKPDFTKIVDCPHVYNIDMVERLNRNRCDLYNVITKWNLKWGHLAVFEKWLHGLVLSPDPHLLPKDTDFNSWTTPRFDGTFHIPQDSELLLDDPRDSCKPHWLPLGAETKCESCFRMLNEQRLEHFRHWIEMVDFMLSVRHIPNEKCDKYVGNDNKDCLERNRINYDNNLLRRQLWIDANERWEEFVGYIGPKRNYTEPIEEEEKKPHRRKYIQFCYPDNLRSGHSHIPFM